MLRTRAAVAAGAVALVLTGCEPLDTGGASKPSGGSQTSHQVEYQTSNDAQTGKGARTGKGASPAKRSVVVRSGSVARVTSRGTGKVKWATQLQRYTGKKNKGRPISWSGPVIAGGNLWLVSTEGQLQSVSPDTGAAGGITELKAGASLAPVVANSTLYVLTSDGRIIAFR